MSINVNTPTANHESIANRWLIVVAVMSATLMQVLDMTIVNVALPHIQGSLGAGPNQISWILTCYLIASAIFMPLTGYFTDILGRKKYLLICIVGFTIASIFCGAAQTLTQIVVFRLLQGIFGAGLAPLSQAIMTDSYPKNELGKAMAIWGTGIMVGPILGPTLGGYLTDIANWRWVFYLNVPVGIATFLIASQVIPETIKRKRSIDWYGLLLIATAIGSLQYFLDRGNQDDWFSSPNITFAALLSITCFVSFIIYSLKSSNQNSVFNLSIFRNRNFSIASILLLLMGLGLFGILIIQPLLLENLLNYPVMTAGIMMAPRGLSCMLSMMMISRLINRLDPKAWIILGIILNAVGMFLGTRYNLNIDTWWLIVPMLLQGFGMGMIFVPLSVVAFSTLQNTVRAEAAGLYSLLRTIGSSIGIAVILTVFSRHTQIAWNQLSRFVNPYNSNFLEFIARLHLSPINPKATQMIGGIMAKQAQILSFIDVFAFIMWSFILMVPLVFLLTEAVNSHDNNEE